jgi:hypothetical protein
MFIPQLPLSSEFIKLINPEDPYSEHQNIASKIVSYMNMRYYQMATTPSFHVSTGMSSNSQIKIQTLLVDIDAPSDNWYFETYINTPIPYVKFYIFSSSRIGLSNPVYMLDILMADDFIANGIADTAFGFDSWLLPTTSFYGKEKIVYAQLKILDILKIQDEALTETNSTGRFIDFLNSLGLSEEIVKVEEGEINDFLLEKDKCISDYLGEGRFAKMLCELGIEPDFYFNNNLFHRV